MPLTPAPRPTVHLSTPPAVSHSTVQLPVAAYIKRLERMAAELASHYLPAALQRHREARSQQPVAAGDGGGGGTAAEAAAEAEALLAEIQVRAWKGRA